MRICRQPAALFSEIEREIANFMQSIRDSANVETMKLSILSENRELMFDDEIDLGLFPPQL